jgi:hypothetical protein
MEDTMMYRVSVSSRGESFIRSGMRFTSSPFSVEVSEATLAVLRAEPMLNVQLYESKQLYENEGDR